VTRDYEVAIEKISLIQAYPQFQGWAESGGANNQSWYDNPNSNKVFKFWN
jgi:LruC domain-containing protein